MAVIHALGCEGTGTTMVLGPGKGERRSDRLGDARATGRNGWLARRAMRPVAHMNDTRQTGGSPRSCTADTSSPAIPLDRNPPAAFAADLRIPAVYVIDRPERLRWDTAAWIDRHVGGPAYGLLMRQDSDRLPRGAVLSGLYRRCIRGCVDDALAVCSLSGGHADMWEANDVPYVVVDDTYPAETIAAPVKLPGAESPKPAEPVMPP